jgi:hypothetical protein
MPVGILLHLVLALLIRPAFGFVVSETVEFGQERITFGVYAVTPALVFKWGALQMGNLFRARINVVSVLFLVNQKAHGEHLLCLVVRYILWKRPDARNLSPVAAYQARPTRSYLTSRASIFAALERRTGLWARCRVIRLRWLDAHIRIGLPGCKMQQASRRLLGIFRASSRHGRARGFSDRPVRC